MSFFEDPPEAEPPPLRRHIDPAWRRIPLEAVPAPFPLSRVVHRTEEVALVLSGVRVWPTGLTLVLTATLHPEREPEGRPLPEALFGGPVGVPKHGLRVGVRHADGTRASYPDGPWTGDAPPRPPAAAITSRGGSGSSDHATVELFLWPLPAAGDIELVFQWRSRGLEETRFTVDGDALRAAAAQVEEIWPGARVPEPEPDSFGYGPGGWHGA